jgi:hypothetical protein
MRNKRRYRTASTPHAGVKHRRGVWHSYIGNEYIGTFDALDKAIAARRAEEVRLGYHANHGRV